MKTEEDGISVPKRQASGAAALLTPCRDLVLAASRTVRLNSTV